MPKICNFEGCDYNQFGGGFCKYHQHKRADKKLKGFKPRKKTGEKDMFNEIWDERKQKDGSHISGISGKLLDQYEGGLFYYNMFAHVLDKKNFPKFRLNKNNIILVVPYEHILIDRGTIADRASYEKENNCSFDIFYKKKEQLKQEYNGTTNT